MGTIRLYAFCIPKYRQDVSRVVLWTGPYIARYPDFPTDTSFELIAFHRMGKFRMCWGGERS